MITPRNILLERSGGQLSKVEMSYKFYATYLFSILFEVLFFSES